MNYMVRLHGHRHLYVTPVEPGMAFCTGYYAGRLNSAIVDRMINALLRRRWTAGRGHALEDFMLAAVGIMLFQILMHDYPQLKYLREVYQATNSIIDERKNMVKIF